LYNSIINEERSYALNLTACYSVLCANLQKTVLRFSMMSQSQTGKAHFKLTLPWLPRRLKFP